MRGFGRVNAVSFLDLPKSPLIGRQQYEVDQHIDRLFTGFLNPPLMHRGGIVTRQMFLLLTFMARTFGCFQR